MSGRCARPRAGDDARAWGGAGDRLRWRATALALALALEGWLAAALWRWLTQD